MNPRTITVGVLVGALAVAGSTIVHAVSDDPREQVALALTIAGAVVSTVLFIGLLSRDD